MFNPLRNARLKAFWREFTSGAKFGFVVSIITFGVVLLVFFSGYYYIENYFLITVSTSNAIEIFRTLASVNAVLIGFMVLMTSTTVGNIERYLLELRLRVLGTPQLPDEIIEGQLEAFERFRLIVIALDLASIGLLFMSIITSLNSIAGVPNDPANHVTRSIFTIPIGLTLTAMALFAFRLILARPPALKTKDCL